MKKFAFAFAFGVLVLAAAACSSKGPSDTGKVIKSAPVGNNLTATLSNNDGVLKNGDNDSPAISASITRSGVTV